MIYYLLTILTALAVSYAVMFPVRKMAGKRGFLDLPEERKLHKRAVPYGGGVGLSQSLVDVGEPREWGWILRGQFAGLAVVCLGLLKLLKFQMRQSQVVVHRRIVGHLGQGALIRIQGLGPLAFPGVVQACSYCRFIHLLVACQGMHTPFRHLAR